MSLGPEFRGLFTGGALIGLVLACVYAAFPRSYTAGIIAQGLPLLAAGFVVLAVCFLLSGATIRAIGSLAAAAAIAAHLWLVVSGMPTAPTTAAEEAVPFKVVSFNLLNENRTPPDELLDHVLSLDADVLVLMESRPLWKVRDRLRKTYPYGIGCDGDYWACGSMIASKHPTSNVEIADLGSAFRQRFVRVLVDTPAGPLSVVGLHLTKFYFDDFSDREVERAVKRIEGIEGPMVLTGDFNAAPWSRPVRDIVDNGGFQRIAGEPATWPVDFGDNGIAIDHMLVRGGIAVASIAAVDPKGSNHRGIQAELLLPGRP